MRPRDRSLFRPALSLLGVCLCAPLLACPAKQPQAEAEVEAEAEAKTKGGEGGEAEGAKPKAKAEGFSQLEGVQALTLPAGPRSSAASLAASDGGVWLSWMSEAGEAPALMVAKGTPAAEGGLSWSEPETVAAGPGLIVDWLNVPAVVESSAGTLIVAWAQLNDATDASKGYGLRLSAREDGGGYVDAWDPLEDLGGSKGPEAGFPAFVVTGEVVRLFWLDGADRAPEELGGKGDEGAMQLRTMLLDAEGKRGAPARVVDPRVSDCSPISAQLIGSRPYVAYRDRSDEELRDIAVVEPGKAPKIVAEDGWKVEGCSSNGPAVAPATTGSMHVAWFAAPEGKREVRLAIGSASQGFDEPIVASLGRPIGHPTLVGFEGGQAEVSWIEVDEKEKLLARLLTRRVRTDGELGPTFVVSEIGVGPAWGTPQNIRLGDQLLWVFTNPGNGNVDTELAGYLAPAPPKP
ncbi:BNR repeat, putative [Plesiocystis pacifica SIR-1]|uniref:BNR repeat, putative n=1 Tax=Plesiocystis pacifica SIR-1 TaxID=391625 RepID=A6GJA9_9BACT|nr:hypothetical protein [Plesiocystis pacifica]EDM74054.1 BNR repeat, putative [Plesiocystis pacifica SIR-1]